MLHFWIWKFKGKNPNRQSKCRKTKQKRRNPNEIQKQVRRRSELLHRLEQIYLLHMRAHYCRFIVDLSCSVVGMSCFAAAGGASSWGYRAKRGRKGFRGPWTYEAVPPISPSSALGTKSLAVKTPPTVRITSTKQEKPRSSTNLSGWRESDHEGEKVTKKQHHKMENRAIERERERAERPEREGVTLVREGSRRVQMERRSPLLERWLGGVCRLPSFLS